MCYVLYWRGAEGREAVRHGELATGAAGGGELAAVPRARGHREGRAPRDGAHQTARRERARRAASRALQILARDRARGAHSSTRIDDN